MAQIALLLDKTIQDKAILNKPDKPVQKKEVTKL
jgi:hypothetical protein